jgi:DNA-binding PadR family transcriptional regulator
MAVLATLERAEFTYLREHVKTTDGNLATHLRKLEEAGYLRVAKRFEARKPVTDYALTARGRRALGEHLDQIERLLGPARR